MKIRCLSILILLLSVSTISSYSQNKNKSNQLNIDPIYIYHSVGGISGIVYSTSISAINIYRWTYFYGWVPSPIIGPLRISSYLGIMIPAIGTLVERKKQMKKISNFIQTNKEHSPWLKYLGRYELIIGMLGLLTEATNILYMTYIIDFERFSFGKIKLYEFERDTSLLNIGLYTIPLTMGILILKGSSYLKQLNKIAINANLFIEKKEIGISIRF